MRKLPGAIFIIDPNNEHIAVKEANVLGIPVVAVTDTNCDPTGIEYVVPGNDDALKSITLFLDYFASAINEGGSKARKEAGDDQNRDIDLEREILEKYEKDIDLQGDEEV
jgi:small subunit ribosomal protein S2